MLAKQKIEEAKKVVFKNKTDKIVYFMDKFKEIKNFSDEKYFQIEELSDKNPLMAPRTDKFNLSDLVTIFKDEGLNPFGDLHRFDESVVTEMV